MIKNRKIKKYIIPSTIIIIFVALIIVATILYFTMVNNKRIKINVDFNTISLQEIADKVSKELDVSESSIGLLNDSTIQFEEGKVKKIDFHLIVKTGTKIEYWEIQNTVDCVDLIYMNEIKEDVIVNVSLKTMLSMLNLAQKTINARTYTASFSNIEHNQAVNIMGNDYYLNNENFEKVSSPILGRWYSFNMNLLNPISTHVFFYK